MHTAVSAIDFIALSHWKKQLGLRLGYPTLLVSSAGFAVSSLTSPHEIAQAQPQPIGELEFLGTVIRLLKFFGDLT